MADKQDDVGQYTTFLLALKTFITNLPGQISIQTRMFFLLDRYIASLTYNRFEISVLSQSAQ